MQSISFGSCKDYFCHFYLILLAPVYPLTQCILAHSTQSHLLKNISQITSFTYQRPHITFRMKLKLPQRLHCSAPVLLDSFRISHPCSSFTSAIHTGLLSSFQNLHP